MLDVDRFEPRPTPPTERPRVTALLDEVTEGPGVTWVEASPGSGSTTAVAHWFAHRRGAWLTLTRWHADRTVFWNDVVATVARAAGEPRADWSGGSWDAEALDAIAGSRAPLGLLVLDEAHHVDGLRLTADLGALRDRLPGLRIVLCAPPSASLASSLPAMAPLSRVDEAALRATDEEATAVLRTARPGLDAGIGRAVRAAVRGRMGRVRLAALLLSLGVEPDSLDSVLREAATLDRLVGLLLDHVPPPWAELLVRCCVLDDLDAERCGHVLDGADAGPILDELVAHGVLVAGGRSGALHLPTALREGLRARLAVDPAALAGSHRRAGEWCLAAGQVAAGVEHLLLAGERERALRALRGPDRVLAAQGRVGTLRRLLDLLPGEAAPWRPEDLALLARLQASACVPHLALATLTLARSLGDEDLPDDAALDLDAALAMVRFALGQPELGPPVLRLLDRVGGPPAGPVPPATQGRRELVAECGSLLVREQAWTGEAASAKAVATRLARLASRLPDDGRVHLLLQAADMHVRLAEGRLHDAEALLLVLEAGRDRGAPAPVLVVLDARLGRARLARLRGRLDDPATGTERLQRLAQDARDQGRERLAVAALIELARAELGRGALEGAREASGRAGRMGAPLGGVAAADAIAAECEILLAADDAVTAAQLMVRLGTSPPERLLRARIALALGNAGAAATHLHALAGLTAAQTPLVTTTRHLLLAVARTEGAARTSALVDAVAAAAPHGLVAPFLQLPGPAAERLRDLLPADAFGDEVRRALDVLPRGAGATVALLSTRELEVLELLRSPLELPQIAAQLFISRNTLKSHLRSIYTKLDVGTRADAVRAGTARGLFAREL